MGLVWDPKLTWIPHIAQLKDKVMKAMNLLRSITCAWGSDTKIGMRQYIAVISPKLDYGCFVHGTASTATLRSLDVLANEALRITSGAFKTTPVSSLEVLVIVVVGQTIGSISSKMLANDCLYALEFCTVSVIATS